MQFKELIVGQRYILKSPRGAVATFEGKHGSGLLVLADQSTYHGGSDYLKFLIEGTDGSKRLVLLPTGADVEEAETTKLLREQLEAERDARKAAAAEQATALLTRLGFTITDRTYASGDEPLVVSMRWPQENVDDIELGAFTIGKLKHALEHATDPFRAQEVG